MNQRAYIDIEVPKYCKIILGKIIFWLWLLKTPGKNCKKLKKIGNFEAIKYLVQIRFRQSKLASKEFFIILAVTSFS